jgi:non-heme Fe2+,alpha-ketoglutarate-dependent halogenase
MAAAAMDTEWQRDIAQQGLCFPINVLTIDEAQRYRRACDRLEDCLGGRPRTVEVRQMHLHFPWAYELATHPAILGAVTALLGKDLLIWATELFAKHPQDAAMSIAWHRDKDYMGFDSPRTLTAWVALSPSDRANGCLEALPGPGRALEARPGPEQPTVAVVLRPGDMSLHDSEILHGSGPNLSTEKRVGFAIRFVVPSVRPRHGRPRAVLASGHDSCGYFELAGPPDEATEEAALRGLRGSAAAHLDNILANLSDRVRTTV